MYSITKTWKLSFVVIIVYHLNKPQSQRNLPMRSIMFEDLVHFIGHKNLIIGLLPGEPLFKSSDIIQGPHVPRQHIIYKYSYYLVLIKLKFFAVHRWNTSYAMRIRSKQPLSCAVLSLSSLPKYKIDTSDS